MKGSFTGRLHTHSLMVVCQMLTMATYGNRCLCFDQSRHGMAVAREGCGRFRTFTSPRLSKSVLGILVTLPILPFMGCSGHVFSWDIQRHPEFAADNTRTHLLRPQSSRTQLSGPCPTQLGRTRGTRTWVSFWITAGSISTRSDRFARRSNSEAILRYSSPSCHAFRSHGTAYPPRQATNYEPEHAPR